MMQVHAKFTYRFDEKRKIFFKSYHGNITIKDIKASWLNLFAQNLIPESTHGFVLDYSNAELNMGINDYQMIPEFYKSNLDYFLHKRIAIITDNPRNVVIPTLVKTLDDGYESRPFATEKAAIDWVLAK